MTLRLNTHAKWAALGGSLLLGLLMFGPSAFAVDTITASVFKDTDEDGQVDIIQWTMDENVVICDYEAGDWTVDVGGDLNVSSIDSIACTGSDAILELNIATDDNITGGTVVPSVSYANAGTSGSVKLTSGNMDAHSSVDALDAAAPAFISVTPADGATLVALDTDIVIVFTEPMDTTFAEGTEFSIAPDLGAYTSAWTVNDTTVTISQPRMACGVSYVFTTDNAEIDAANGSVTTSVTTGDVDGDATFTTTTSGCSGNTSQAAGTSNSVSTNATMTLEDVVGPLDAGTSYEIAWEATNAPYIDLYYSVDSGETWMTIERFLRNDGFHVWSVPEMLDNDSVIVKAEANDLADVLASDTTAPFSVEPMMVVVEEDADEEVVEEESMPAPVQPNVPGVLPGDVVRTSDSSALYYITAHYTRRAFLNQQTYFTWFPSFTNVKVISANDLKQFTLDGVMLPKAGVVLVKIQSDNAVYVLGQGEGTDSVLRRIRLEADAIRIFGASWADYVIDVEPTHFARFAKGSDVSPSETFDMSLMRRRMDLHQ